LSTTAAPARDDKILSTDNPLPIDWTGELDAHRGWMTDVARARVDDQHAVEDVMQEVSLAVFRQNGHPNDPSKIRAWLYRIVVRRAAAYMRGKYRQKKLVESVGESGEQLSQQADPDWVLASERGELLRKALALMSQDERELFVLKYSENWSYRRLAERFGVSDRVVEYRLVRAKQNLRAKLAALHNSEDKS